MKKSSISITEVSKHCEQMDKLANDMKTILDSVQFKNKRLVSSDIWHGPAANYYIEKLTNLSANFEEIYQELEYSVLWMATSISNYESLNKDLIEKVCKNLNLSEPNLDNSRVFPNS